MISRVGRTRWMSWRRDAGDSCSPGSSIASSRSSPEGNDSSCRGSPSILSPAAIAGLIKTMGQTIGSVIPKTLCEMGSKSSGWGKDYANE